MERVRNFLVLTLLGAALWSGNANAQDDAETDGASVEGQNAVEGEGEDIDKSQVDPNPIVPGQEEGEGMDTKVIQQAGTGGDVAFATKGVLEVGGAGRFEVSGDGMLLSLRPSIGWFLADNFELSGSVEVNYANPDQGSSYATFGIFAEPSLHLPLTNRLLWFVGTGIGLAYNDTDFGLALRPRLGLDILIGRSGILRPAVELTWSTADVVSTSSGTALAVNTSFGASFGYHVMF